MNASATMTEIDAGELRNLLNDGNGQVRLIDVRTPAEFDECHIDGSELHPLDRFDAEQVKSSMSEDVRAILVCKSGKRSSDACKKLQSSGCDAAVILTGGVDGWKAAGFPVKESGRKVISLERQVRIAAGALALTGAILGFTVDSLWHILPGFIGAGLLFAGLTDTCGMAMILARMPWNQRRKLAKA